MRTGIPWLRSYARYNRSAKSFSHPYSESGSAGYADSSRQSGLSGIKLIVLWIHASRSRIEDFSQSFILFWNLIPVFSISLIKFTLPSRTFRLIVRVMHDVCIIFTSENETCTTHISSKLIDLIECLNRSDKE